jgi:hypothetical protein
MSDIWTAVGVMTCVSAGPALVGARLLSTDKG